MRLTAVLRSKDDPENVTSGEADKAFDRRRSTRRSLRLEANLTIISSGDIRVLVQDVSPGGLMFEAEADALSVDDYIEVALPDARVAKGRVAWTSGRLFGCEFNEPVSASAISAALLKSEPRNAENNRAVSTVSEEVFPGRQPRLVPELSFSAAISLALVLWVAIGAAVYFFSR